MSVINNLADLFTRFPGIGPRQGKRFVYFLLRQNPRYIENLISHLSSLKESVHVCDKCFQYFPAYNSEENLCDICKNPNREQGLLMVVEKDTDIENVEKSGAYNGLYFVLGGTIPLSSAEDIPPYVRTQELQKRVEGNALDEIILATNATTEGDHTREVIEKLIRKSVGENATVSFLGRGLSTGTELEYSDKDTLRNALSNRKTSR